MWIVEEQVWSRFSLLTKMAAAVHGPLVEFGLSTNENILCEHASLFQGQGTQMLASAARILSSFLHRKLPRT